MWLFTSSKTNLKKDKSSEDEDPFFELAKELDANQSSKNLFSLNQVDILSFALDTAVIAKASALEKHVTNHKDKLNWDFLQKVITKRSFRPFSYIFRLSLISPLFFISSASSVYHLSSKLY